MALIKCKECGEEISNKAKDCPKCGAPVKKKTSLFTWIVAIVSVVLMYNYFSKPDVGRRLSGGTTQARTATSKPFVPTWDYRSYQDDMTGKTTYRANIGSLNKLTFGFPYNGEQRATLILRTHPQYGKDVILKIEKGQFLCGVSDCRVLVRFDDSKAETYRAVEPSDHNTTTLFIQGYSNFIGKMMKTKKLRIQAEFYHEGNRTLEFDVSKFDVGRYLPEKK